MAGTYARIWAVAGYVMAGDQVNMNMHIDRHNISSVPKPGML
jgi:hypothetical protein